MRRRTFIELTALSVTAFAGRGLAAEPFAPRSAAKPFVHPGLLHSREELAFVKRKIAAGEQPWKTAWEKLRASESASLVDAGSTFVDCHTASISEPPAEPASETAPS